MYICVLANLQIKPVGKEDLTLEHQRIVRIVQFSSKTTEVPGCKWFQAVERVIVPLMKLYCL